MLVKTAAWGRSGRVVAMDDRWCRAVVCLGMQDARGPVGYRPARPEDADAIAHVHVASWRSTYRGLLPDALLDGLSVEPRAAYWKRLIEEPPARATYVGVAEAADGIVGFVGVGPEPDGDSGYDAELSAIYLRAEFQGRGIGRELMRRAVAHLRSAGASSMRLWVLDGNSAEDFYRRQGGERVGEKPITIGGVEYTAIAYGWRDLAVFGG